MGQETTQLPLTTDSRRLTDCRAPRDTTPAYQTQLMRVQMTSLLSLPCRPSTPNSKHPPCRALARSLMRDTVTKKVGNCVQLYKRSDDELCDYSQRSKPHRETDREAKSDCEVCRDGGREEDPMHHLVELSPPMLRRNGFFGFTIRDPTDGLVARGEEGPEEEEAAAAAAALLVEIWTGCRLPSSAPAV